MFEHVALDPLWMILPALTALVLLTWIGRRVRRKRSVIVGCPQDGASCTIEVERRLDGFLGVVPREHVIGCSKGAHRDCARACLVQLKRRAPGRPELVKG